jgi:ATP-binding cassette subfamily B protein
LVALLGITNHRSGLRALPVLPSEDPPLLPSREPDAPDVASTADMTGDRLLVACMRGAVPWLVPLVGLALLGAATSLALPAVLGRALDQVVSSAQADHGGNSTTGAVATVAGLVALAVVVDVVSQLIATAATAETTGLLRREVVTQVLDVGPSIAEGGAEGDLVARLVANATTAAKAVALVAGLATSLLPPVGAVVALAVIDLRLAATFVVGMAVASGAVRRYLRDSKAATAGYLAAQGKLAARLVDSLAGARTIAAARTTEREVDRVLAPLDEVRSHGAAVWHNIARLVVRGEPVVLLTQAAVVAVAGLGVAAGRLSPGEMLAASRYAVMAAGISGILDELAVLSRARAASDRLAELLAVPVVRHGRLSLPAETAAPQGRLELSGISAGDALSGLDLVVPGGAVVALVGRSGSGKSLVAALAGRLCDPDEGQVRLDGVPLPDLRRTDLRRAVTYAFERPRLLGATVEEAIAFGIDPVPPNRVRSAAQAARADGFISRLPEGYAAPMAETSLSGGEFQRLGLARALAHNARLVILDDATSSLDTATEAQIAAVLTADDGRTRLIVTHRLATAARADLVAWLDGGKVRACAPHHELWDDPDYQAVFRVDAEPDLTPLPRSPRPQVYEVAIQRPAQDDEAAASAVAATAVAPGAGAGSGAGAEATL